MSNKLTLEQARINAGFSLEQVFEETGYSLEFLEFVEGHSGSTPMDITVSLCRLYKVDLNNVSFQSKETELPRRDEHLYSASRRMAVISEIQQQVSELLLSVIDDGAFTKEDTASSLHDIYFSLNHEIGIVLNEMDDAVQNMKKSLNNTLAGR